VLTALLMGMRVSEVTDRVVRDLDDEGRVLWIEVGKTKRSRRTLEAPAVLRPYLLALAKDRAPTEQLITRAKMPRGNKRGRQWLRHWLEIYCDEAKIPVVCMHSLRGLHATLATEAGVSSHAVASALGHTSPVVTAAHYLQPRHQAPRVFATRGRQAGRAVTHWIP
jgi:integrase